MSAKIEVLTTLYLWYLLGTNKTTNNNIDHVVILSTKNNNYLILYLWKKYVHKIVWDLIITLFSKPMLQRTKRTSASSHWNITCSRHDIDEQFLVWRLSNNYSLTHSNCVNNIYFPSKYCGVKPHNPLLKLKTCNIPTFLFFTKHHFYLL